MGERSGVKRGSIANVVLAMVLMGSVAVWIPAATAGQASAMTGEPKRSYGAIDVIMYQTSWWPYCNKAREFLRGTGVSLTEYDVEKDRQKAEEMTAKSGSRGVPVVDIEGIIIRGYHPDAYKDAIERKRRE